MTFQVLWGLGLIFSDEINKAVDLRIVKFEFGASLEAVQLTPECVSDANGFKFNFSSRF